MTHSWEYYVVKFAAFCLFIYVLDRVPERYRDIKLAVLFSLGAIGTGILIELERERMPSDWVSLISPRQWHYSPIGKLLLISWEVYALEAAFVAGALWYWLASLRKSSPMAAHLIFWTVMLFGAVGAGTIYLVA